MRMSTGILELIVRRLDALQAQVNDRLSTVMRGVREITPKPFEAGQMAGGQADHCTHAKRAHGSDRLMTQVKRVLVPRILTQLGDF